MPDIGDIEAIKIRRPFGMSTTGGSGFPVGRVLECPRKAALTLLGVRMKRLGAPLWFGTLIHENAFRPYTEPEEVKDLAAETEKDIRNAAESEKMIRTETAPDGTETEFVQDLEVSDEDREKLPKIAKLQMEVWDNERYAQSEIEAVEQKARSDLVDPDSGKVEGIADGVRVAGRMDLLLVRDENEQVPVRDLKTAKAALKQEWFLNLGYYRQLSTYRYLLAAGAGEMTDNVACFQLTKHMTKESIQKYAGEIHIRPMPYRRVYDEFMLAWERLLECERHKYWPMNPTACEGKYGPCMFLPLCWAEEFDDSDEWKKTLRIREEMSHG